MTGLSLTYGVLTEYTSFIAVDDVIVNPGGVTRPMNVAVPLPEGVSELALPVLSPAQIQAAGAPALGLDSAEMGDQGVFMCIGAGGGGAGMFGSRNGGGRKRAVASHGGSTASESAVDAGLRFLKRHQGPDGAWDPTRYQDNCTENPKCEAGQGGEDDRLAITAQAVLGFLGAGYDHKTPNQYKRTVAGGVAWLLAQQRPDGGFGATIEAQATTTMALAEAYAMINDPALLKPTQTAVDRLLALRIAGGDGKPLAWGQAPVIDTAASVQAVMALKAAYSGGLVVGDGLGRAKLWLEQAWQAANPGRKPQDQSPSAAGFPAQWSPAGGPSGSEVEAGAMVAVLLGQRSGEVLLETLATAINLGRPETRFADLRRLHLATMVMFQLGGQRWKAWNAATRDTLVNSQRRGDGCFDGSWDPLGQTGLGKERGRLQSTLSARSSLQVYYAYPQVRQAPPPPTGR